MCLTIPMKVQEVRGQRVRCSALGRERWVKLLPLDDAVPGRGDYVVVQLGFVRRIISETEARATLKLIDEISDALEDGAS